MTQQLVHYRAGRGWRIATYGGSVVAAVGLVGLAALLVTRHDPLGAILWICLGVAAVVSGRRVVREVTFDGARLTLIGAGRADIVELTDVRRVQPTRAGTRSGGLHITTRQRRYRMSAAGAGSQEL